MKLTACIHKELLMLLRDRAGLLLLFIMPAVLVVVITMVQQRVTATGLELLFVDEDGGSVGELVKQNLEANDTLQLQTAVDGTPLTAARAKQLVASGASHFAVLIAPGTTQQMVPGAAPAEISLCFDPAVQGGFRAAAAAVLQQAVRETQLSLLPPPLQEMAGAAGSQLVIRQRFVSDMGFTAQPTAVQQNVPAWSIFGIFFLAVPLAGSLVHERQSGLLRRLQTMPVDAATILCGKLAAFSLVGALQAAGIVAAGIYLLPCAGLPAFAPGAHLAEMTALFAAVIMAACGYGLLLGTWGRSYEQVSTFTPVSIVVAAAVGGIMVPVFAMPELLRPLCRFSPLYWAQSGFYDLLLRGGSWQAIGPEVAALLGFTLCCLSAATMRWRRHI